MFFSVSVISNVLSSSLHHCWYLCIIITFAISVIIIIICYVHTTVIVARLVNIHVLLVFCFNHSVLIAFCKFLKWDYCKRWFLTWFANSTAFICFHFIYIYIYFPIWSVFILKKVCKIFNDVILWIIMHGGFDSMKYFMVYEWELSLLNRLQK